MRGTVLGIVVVSLLIVGLGCVGARRPIRVVVTEDHGSLIKACARFEDAAESDPDPATATWLDDTDVNGWTFFEVHTDSAYDWESQGYAAGVLEGYLAATRIKYMFLNGDMFYYKKQAGVVQFAEENLNWTRTQVSSHPEDTYWKYIGATLAQMDGLVDGYAASNESATFPLDSLDFLMLELDDETYDIALYVDPTHKQTVKEKHMGDHCSALIRLNEAKDDIMIAHNTWTTYQYMMKVLKLQDFSFAPTVVFSGHPGLLFSNDDYYILDNGLVVMETTIPVYDETLYSQLSPYTVAEWLRTMVANAIAPNGQEWTDVYSQYNSGTYCNQWMVLDYNKFVPGEDIAPDTLWVLEQLPGFIIAEDQSTIFHDTQYWASYNRAFYPEVQELSGAVAQRQKYGDYYSYNNTARSLIFARDQSGVNSIEDMERMMMYNDFKNDPLSRCDGCDPPYSGILTIAARCELTPIDGVYPFPDLEHSNLAAIDAKATNLALSQRLALVAQAAPTHDIQPVFDWASPAILDRRHYGQPQVWDFDWIDVEWPLAN
ncbi:Phospholipase B [Pelomyxa schiedti]|nr:Phospholipase B [Pelomyxa schiedti]